MLWEVSCCRTIGPPSTPRRIRQRTWCMCQRLVWFQRVTITASEDNGSWLKGGMKLTLLVLYPGQEILLISDEPRFTSKSLSVQHKSKMLIYSPVLHVMIIVPSGITFRFFTPCRAHCHAEHCGGRSAMEAHPITSCTTNTACRMPNRLHPVCS